MSVQKYFVFLLIVLFFTAGFAAVSDEKEEVQSFCRRLGISSEVHDNLVESFNPGMTLEDKKDFMKFVADHPFCSSKFSDYDELRQEMDGDSPRRWLFGSLIRIDKESREYVFSVASRVPTGAGNHTRDGGLFSMSNLLDALRTKGLYFVKNVENLLELPLLRRVPEGERDHFLKVYIYSVRADNTGDARPQAAKDKALACMRKSLSTNSWSAPVLENGRTATLAVALDLLTGFFTDLGVGASTRAPQPQA